MVLMCIGLQRFEIYFDFSYLSLVVLILISQYGMAVNFSSDADQ